MTSIQVGNQTYPTTLIPAKDAKKPEDAKLGVQAHAENTNRDAVIVKTKDEVMVAYLPVSANPDTQTSIKIDGLDVDDFEAIDNEPDGWSKAGKVVDNIGASVNEFFGNRIDSKYNTAVGGVTLAAGAAVGGVLLPASIVGAGVTKAAVAGYALAVGAIEAAGVGIAASQMTDKEFDGVK